MCSQRSHDEGILIDSNCDFPGLDVVALNWKDDGVNKDVDAC